MEIQLAELLSKYIIEQALVLIPVLYIIGLFLKKSALSDWLIPWILLVISIIFSICILGFNVNSVIQGILVTGATVYANQLYKQSIEKR